MMRNIPMHRDSRPTIFMRRSPGMRHRGSIQISTSRRYITPPGFDNQFALRFLSRGIDVEFQFTRRPVPLLVRRDKSQVVAAPQVVDQRLKGRVEFFRFVRKYFTAGFVRQIFQVNIVGSDYFVHAGRNGLEDIFDTLSQDFGNDRTNDGA